METSAVRTGKRPEVSGTSALREKQIGTIRLCFNEILGARSETRYEARKKRMSEAMVAVVNAIDKGKLTETELAPLKKEAVGIVKVYLDEVSGAREEKSYGTRKSRVSEAIGMSLTIVDKWSLTGTDLVSLKQEAIDSTRALLKLITKKEIDNMGRAVLDIKLAEKAASMLSRFDIYQGELDSGTVGRSWNSGPLEPILYDIVTQLVEQGALFSDTNRTKMDEDSIEIAHKLLKGAQLPREEIVKLGNDYFAFFENRIKERKPKTPDQRKKNPYWEYEAKPLTDAANRVITVFGLKIKPLDDPVEDGIQQRKDENV